MARSEYIVKSFRVNGKRYYVYGKTDEEAIEARTLKKAEIEGKLKTQKKSSGYTVEEWAKKWLETYKADASDTWYKHMKSLIENHIVPAFGSRPISSIKQADIVKLLNSSNHLSESHNHKLLIVVRQIFESAEENDIIDKSPARYVKQPKSKEKQPRRTITSLERGLTIRTAEKNLSVGLFYLVMLYCGCRPGEVAALTKKDFDMKSKTLHITKAVKSNNLIGPPKNSTSVRDIPIPDVLCEFLKGELKKRKNSELVFTSAQGRMLTKDLRARQWKKFKRLMEIENGAKLWRLHVVEPTLADDLTPYCYRHTYCTDLQDAGVPVTVASRLMGHSSIRITSDIYTHHTEESFEDARTKINKSHKKENSRTYRIKTKKLK